MKVSSATLNVAVLAVAFFASSEGTANSSTACSTYCTHTLCRTSATAAVAWLPDTQSYVTAEEAQASGDTAFYSVFVGNPTLTEMSLRDEAMSGSVLVAPRAR